MAQRGEIGQNLPVTIGGYTGSGSTQSNMVQVTFIFGGTFSGTVGGATFVSADVPFTVFAIAEDTLAPIPYTVTAGTLRIVQVG